MLIKHLIFFLALAHLTLATYQVVKVSNLQNGGQVRDEPNFPERFLALKLQVILSLTTLKCLTRVKSFRIPSLIDLHAY